MLLAVAGRPPKRGIPLAALAAAEAKPVREVALDASARLTRRGVPHALVGGLAVQAHGFERYTKDVDLLVPSHRPEVLKEVRGGVALDFRPPLFRGTSYTRRGVVIDLIQPADPRTLFLDAELRLPDSAADVPVARVEAIVAMKLLGGRAQDDADVVRLLHAGAAARAVRNYLEAHAPRLLARFERLARRAARERR